MGPRGSGGRLVVPAAPHQVARKLDSGQAPLKPPRLNCTTVVTGTSRGAECGGEDKVSLFYDGKCPICAYEVGHYQRLDRDKERIRFLDINDDRVKDELAKRGLTFDDAMARMYVETKDGRLVEGVESFVQVWHELPYWRHLVPLARVPGVTWVLHHAYTAWARNRLWLTGRQH